MHDRFLPFYLDGRDAKLARIRKLCPEAEEIAQRLLAGAFLRAEISAATEQAARTIKNDLKWKKKWIADNAEDAGAHVEEAFNTFVEGLSDELAYVLEDEVLHELAQTSGGEDDDDEEEDDDDDQGDEEETSASVS